MLGKTMRVHMITANNMWTDAFINSPKNIPVFFTYYSCIGFKYYWKHSKSRICISTPHT